MNVRCAKDHMDQFFSTIRASLPITVRLARQQYRQGNYWYYNLNKHQALQPLLLLHRQMAHDEPAKYWLDLEANSPSMKWQIHGNFHQTPANIGICNITVEFRSQHPISIKFDVPGKNDGGILKLMAVGVLEELQAINFHRPHAHIRHSAVSAVSCSLFTIQSFSQQQNKRVRVCQSRRAKSLHICLGL